MSGFRPTTRFGRWVDRVGKRPLSGPQRIAIVGLLIAVSVALTALALHRDSSESAHERALVDGGSRSQARVEKVFRDPKGGFVQLTVAIIDGDAVGWEVRVSVDPGTTISEGDQVEVAYDADDPGDLVVVGEARAPNNGLAIGAWLLTVGVSAVFAWSSWRGRARNSTVPT